MGKAPTVTINKKFLAESLVDSFDVTKALAARMVDNVFGNIVVNLELDNEVDIHGFGKFSIAHRDARTGRNPSTGAAIEVPAKKAVKFKPSKTLKDAVN